MDRILVVLDETAAHEELLAEAGAVSVATDAELVLFSWVTPDEIEESSEAMRQVGDVERASYGSTSAEELVTAFVDRFAADVFDGEPPEYRAAGGVVEDSNLASEIVSTATELDCDYVYVVGKKRSPTGKAVFGDVAQRVLLNFDGYVTVTVR